MTHHGDDPPDRKPAPMVRGILDPEQFSVERQAELKANDDAAAQWLADLKALAFWDCYDRNRPQ
jgi:hypothetical protein